MIDSFQLTIGFDHRESLSGEDFLVAPCNVEAVRWLDEWRKWTSPVFILYGPAGCGKTHLTNVFISQTNGRDITNDLEINLEPSLVLDHEGAYVIEGADRIANSGLAENLLHFYNVAVEVGARILLTAHLPVSKWTIPIPDLRSRLKSAQTIGIGSPDDRLIGSLLIKLFNDRQLNLDKDVIPYMLARMERSFEEAQNLVAKIDHLALSKHRKITIPLVRQVFEQLCD